jgi:hypothetical protein
MLYIFVMYAPAASNAPERRSRFPRKRNKASDKSVLKYRNEKTRRLGATARKILHTRAKKMEPTTGIEPVTYGLRNRCSTS